MDSIKCPHCGKKVDVDEALRHQLEGKIKIEQESIAKTKFEKQIKEEIAEREIIIIKQAKSKNKQIELESKEKEKELVAAKKDKKILEEKIANEEEAREKRELKIREEESEKSRLDKLAYEKKLSDMQKSLEDAQRKGKQGSQQLQGDVLEIDLEERLKKAFPYDNFKPVPTGVRGGDIIHEIKNKYGNNAGVILWEAKRRKTWSKGWIEKLKDDMREIKASDSILVTEVLPPKVSNYDRIENVWVTSYEFAVKLADVVRFGLLKVAIAKSTASQSDEKLKELYDVITSDSFRGLFEARDEIISSLRQELEADKRSSEKRWKRQGNYIDKLDRNNSKIYGELQAHIPALKPLNEPHLLKDDNESLF